MFREPTVFVVDGDGQSRDSLRRLLESMRVQCLPCRSGQEFFEQHDGCWLGCAVLELRIADMSGLQIQRRLLDSGVLLPTLFLTEYGTIGSAVRCLKAGAVDFLEKPCADDDLWDAIQQAIQLSHARHEKLIAYLQWEQRVATLTTLQNDLLEMIVDGQHNQEIAVVMNVSIRTVEARRSKLLAKLDVNSTHELLLAVSEQHSREASLASIVNHGNGNATEPSRIALRCCASAQAPAHQVPHQACRLSGIVCQWQGDGTESSRNAPSCCALAQALASRAQHQDE